MLHESVVVPVKCSPHHEVTFPLLNESQDFLTRIFSEIEIEIVTQTNIFLTRIYWDSRLRKETKARKQFQIPVNLEFSFLKAFFFFFGKNGPDDPNRLRNRTRKKKLSTGNPNWKLQK